MTFPPTPTMIVNLQVIADALHLMSPMDRLALRTNHVYLNELLSMVEAAYPPRGVTEDTKVVPINYLSDLAHDPLAVPIGDPE